MVNLEDPRRFTMTEKDFIEVTVKEAAHEDADRGIARISVEVMKKLGLVSGDILEIHGKRKAAAIVWPGFATDTGERSCGLTVISEVTSVLESVRR